MKLHLLYACYSSLIVIAVKTDNREALLFVMVRAEWTKRVYTSWKAWTIMNMKIFKTLLENIQFRKTKPKINWDKICGTYRNAFPLHSMVI